MPLAPVSNGAHSCEFCASLNEEDACTVEGCQLASLEIPACQAVYELLGPWRQAHSDSPRLHADELLRLSSDELLASGSHEELLPSDSDAEILTEKGDSDLD